MNSKCYEFLGIKVNLLSMIQLNLLIMEAVELNKKWIIANHNLNSLYIYHHNSMMRKFYSIADYIHLDGMALVLLGKLYRIPCKRKHRVTYADWVWSLMAEASTRGWRVFYLGSKPGVANRGANILREKYPNLKITTMHGHFPMSASSRENQVVLTAINSYKPQILMVGMGMPRQEKWILENIENVHTNAILTSGACIDYVAGEIATPPRWMGKIGMEWFYRLVTEPKRLWKRYLLDPWFIVKLLLQEFHKNSKNTRVE